MRKRFFRAATLSIAVGLVIAFLFAVPLMEQIYTCLLYPSLHQNPQPDERSGGGLPDHRQGEHRRGGPVSYTHLLLREIPAAVLKRCTGVRSQDQLPLFGEHGENHVHVVSLLT